MDQHVRTFFNRSARGFQFGRVDRHSDFVRMTFFNCRPNDRPKRIDRMIFVDDVPNFYEIRFLLRELAHEVAGLLWRVDLQDRRVAEIEFLARDAGD